MKNTPDIQLITLCLENNADAQHTLYQRYASRMMVVCRRYAASRDDAEDLLQEGFIIVFLNLGKYKGDGSFEGWIRSIIVRLAIRKWHNKIKMETETIDNHFELADHAVSIIESLSVDELIHKINLLPAGYKMIFNMYVLDGFSHAEIAKLTGIKESTSRSQLVKARSMLQKMILAEQLAVTKKYFRDENN